MFEIKIVTLSEKILKFIVTEYKETGKPNFSFDNIKNKFNITDNMLINAISLLEEDGFLKIFYADNIPYTIILLPDGIRNCEENSWIKKGYSLIKEIKTLLR